MTYWFCAKLTDDLLGTTIAEDIECEVAVEVRLAGGSLEAEVTDVLIGGKSLFRGDGLSQQIAAIIADQAQHEIDDGGDLWGRVREAEGLCFTGRNGNDPDGIWLRVA